MVWEVKVVCESLWFSREMPGSGPKGLWRKNNFAGFCKWCPGIICVMMGAKPSGPCTNSNQLVNCDRCDQTRHGKANNNCCSQQIRTWTSKGKLRRKNIKNHILYNSNFTPQANCGAQLYATCFCFIPVSWFEVFLAMATAIYSQRDIKVEAAEHGCCSCDWILWSVYRCI